MRPQFLNVRSPLAALVLGAALVTTACQKASPTRPTDIGEASATAESVTDARTGATIIAGRPLAPANGAQLRWSDQPFTLQVRNGVTTGSSAITYTFQVASDAAFTRIVVTRDVGQGASGTTSAQVTGLGGPQTYFWRAQANIQAGPGPYSAVWQFTVGPRVVLGTPTLASPTGGQRAGSPLALTIANISREGPVDAIRYEVQVANDSGFSNVLFNNSGNPAQETPGSTTTVTAAVNGLVDGTTYFWRARAVDAANSVTTPYSATASFVAESFNLANAKFWDNPPDTGTWPIGARITSIEFVPNVAMRVDFDRRDGPNRWPDVIPPGFQGPLQYTLGMCRNINGQWHCSAVVQFWYGRDLNSTAPASRFWREWWYDAARWGPLADVRPNEGNTVGVFVASGDLRMRFHTRATCPRVCEISNVVMVPFTEGYALYTY
jgi:hypothetical protein